MRPKAVVTSAQRQSSKATCTTGSLPSRVAVAIAASTSASDVSPRHGDSLSRLLRPRRVGLLFFGLPYARREIQLKKTAVVSRSTSLWASERTSRYVSRRNRSDACSPIAATRPCRPISNGSATADSPQDLITTHLGEDRRSELKTCAPPNPVDSQRADCDHSKPPTPTAGLLQGPETSTLAILLLVWRS
jgi:hypothetical protein